jgi:DNA modification methylase
MSPNVLLAQRNAVHLPFQDTSIHTVIFSPPYWAMRLYAGDGQSVVWPGLTYHMPGGEIVVPGDLDCEHEWITEEQKMRRGRIGDRSTLTGGQNTQAMSRLVAPGRERRRHGRGRSAFGAPGRYHDDLRASEVVGQAVSAGVCARCGAWRGPLGLEPTPEMYVGHLVLLLREIHRVLRDDGTCWLNLGFTNYGSWGNYGSRDGKQRPSHTQHWHRRVVRLSAHDKAYEADDGYQDRPPTSFGHPVYKEKDVVPVPWLVAIAAQYEGWYLRSPVVWSKPNARPDSARDRPTLDYEHVLLLAKSRRYYFDVEAVREPVAGASRSDDGKRRFRRATWDAATEAARLALDLHAAGHPLEWALRFALGQDPERPVAGGATLWRVTTRPYPGAHYATWPPALAARMVQAGTAPAVCARCGRPWQRVANGRPATRDGGEARVWAASRAMWAPGCDCFDHRPTWQDDAGGGLAGGKVLAGDEALTGGKVLAGEDATHPTCTTCGEPHTAPATALDVTAGSGTTVQVARTLGRIGLGLDISRVYLRDQARRRVAWRPKGLHPRPDVPAVIHRRSLPENDWYLGAMEEIVPGLPQRSVDLVFLDPPFNLGKGYGGRVAPRDRLDGGRYRERLHLWLDCVLPLLKPAGSLVVHHLPLRAAQIAAYLVERGWFLRRWVAWKTTGGRISRDLDMVPRHYPFLWFTRGGETKINKVLVPHFRCARCGGYGDHWGGKEKYRDPDGLAMGDVWLTPTRVAGRGKTRQANELPLEAVLRWVLALTDPGAYVFDPFLGSGTTGAACELSGRRWGGVERVGDNAPVIRVKTLVARGAAGVVGDVEAMPAASRYALTKALERTWGKALRRGDVERGDDALLEIGAQVAVHTLAAVSETGPFSRLTSLS